MCDIISIEKYKAFTDWMTGGIKICLNSTLNDLKEEEKLEHNNNDSTREFFFSGLHEMPKVLQRIIELWECCKNNEKEQKNQVLILTKDFFFII